MRDFDLDHFNLISQAIFESIGTEFSIGCATAKVARSDLPDNIAALFVIRAESTLSRIVVKVCRFGTSIYSFNCMSAQGAKTHGGAV